MSHIYQFYSILFRLIDPTECYLEPFNQLCDMLFFLFVLQVLYHDKHYVYDN